MFALTSWNASKKNKQTEDKLRVKKIDMLASGCLLSSEIYDTINQKYFTAGSKKKKKS